MAQIHKGMKPKTVEWWQNEIKEGVKYRRIFGQSGMWKKYKMMYRGIWQRGVIPVNIVYAVGRSMIPQVYFRNPRVGVASKRPGFGPHAMILERVDNYLIRETGVKTEMKSNALDAYLCGVGPGVLGYDSEYGFNPSFEVDSDLQDSGLTSFGKKGERIEYVDNVKPGMPWYLRCNPSDFVVPWGTRCWQEARWFAFRKMRTLRDIKEDPKLGNKGNLAAPYHTKMEGSVEGNPDLRQRQGEKDSNNNWVELWQVHDKRSGRVYTLSLDHPRFLRDEVDHLQLEGLPGLTLGFNEDPDYFWWPSDVRMIEVQQEEINDIRTMARKHRRVGLLKMLVDKNLNKDELEKLLDEDPKAVARVDLGPQGDIRKVAAFLQSHVPPDLISYTREVREDVREIIGFSRNQMGSFEEASGRRTAHEAEIVRAASMIRIDERRDIMADHLQNIVRGYNRIIFDQWGAERVVDIVGDDGNRYWVRFTGRDIKGEFHYEINPEEAIPQDQRTRKADAEKFVQMAANVQGIDMRYVLQQWARQFDWLDPKRLLPQSEGEGRSPEKAFLFADFVRRSANGQLGGGRNG